MTPGRAWLAATALATVLLAVAVGAATLLEPHTRGFDRFQGLAIWKIDVHQRIDPEVLGYAVNVGSSQGILGIVNLGGGHAGGGLEQHLEAAARFPGRVLVFMELDERGCCDEAWAERETARLVAGRALGARGLHVPRRLVVDAPRAIRVPERLGSEPIANPGSLLVDALDLPPGGEHAGRRHLETFLSTRASRYEQVRNDLAADATSRLSPYLRLGFVSANEVAHRAAEVPGAEGFVRQLAWRDFFGQLLWSDPRLAWQDLREGPEVPVPMLDPDHSLKLWQDGLTGLPLVDAAMRQLKREGWIHNRARMVAASFLTRRLAIPWQQGARHFARHLVDGDPANNAGGWQWTAGTGTDPRRSRTFNPVLQAKRFDPSGEYVRRYVRELSEVPAPRIFAPWRDPDVLRLTGYPEPVLPVPGE